MSCQTESGFDFGLVSDGVFVTAQLNFSLGETLHVGHARLLRPDSEEASAIEAGHVRGSSGVGSSVCVRITQIRRCRVGIHVIDFVRNAFRHRSPCPHLM